MCGGAVVYKESTFDQLVNVVVACTILLSRPEYSFFLLGQGSSPGFLPSARFPSVMSTKKFY